MVLMQVLLALGAISAPGKLMNTPFSLVLGMTYTYLPFMILPLYGNLAKLDLRLLEAAAVVAADAIVAATTLRLPGRRGRVRRPRCWPRARWFRR
jgi:putrescine transport system permease protein